MYDYIYIYIYLLCLDQRQVSKVDPLNYTSESLSYLDLRIQTFRYDISMQYSYAIRCLYLCRLCSSALNEIFGAAILPFFRYIEIPSLCYCFGIVGLYQCLRVIAYFKQCSFQ